jgi:4-amino-4-deoxy-L-arabinose transferase-like glycosyltransferase
MEHPIAHSNPPAGGTPPLLRALAASLIAASLLLAFLALRRQDPTSDERLYFGVGRELLRGGRFLELAGLGHPPLALYVNSLPLLVSGEAQPSAANPLLLMLCRVTSLLAFGVPLLVAVFLWARDRHGPRAGLLALALGGFSPTLLAHAGLITTDLAVTSASFLALYLFWRAERQRGNPLGWGIALGLALLAKGSAWLFVAAIVVLAAIRRVSGDRVNRAGPVAAGLAVAVLVVNLGYGFSGLLDVAGKRELLDRVPDSLAGRAVARLATPFLPLPYLRSMATQLQLAVQGWPSYLLGEVSRTGWRHYYLVALAVKESVPFLILLLVSLALAWRREELADDLALLIPVGLVLLAFSLGHLQIGVRYVLPALPFLAVFACGLYRRVGTASRAAFVALVAWHGITAVRACPHYIPYFNELVGGPANGYRYLGDSNLDWGQNDSEARAFAAAHGLVLNPRPVPASGGLVVSATRVQGIAARDRQTYRVLREEYDPVGHVGYAYLIYDLSRNRRLPARAP